MKNWKNWARAAAIRAVRTFSQTVIGLIPAAVTIAQVDWKTVLGSAALAAVVSVATSLTGLPEVKEE